MGDGCPDGCTCTHWCRIPQGDVQQSPGQRVRQGKMVAQEVDTAPLAPLCWSQNWNHDNEAFQISHPRKITGGHAQLDAVSFANEFTCN